MVTESSQCVILTGTDNMCGYDIIINIIFFYNNKLYFSQCILGLEDIGDSEAQARLAYFDYRTLKSAHP